MVEGPVTQRRFSRRMMRQAMVAGVSLVVLALIALGGWYLYSAGVKSAANEAEQRRQKEAEQLAAAVAKPFADINARLKELAESAELIALFEQGDKDALQAAATEHAQSFPSVLRLRFLLPGGYELDDQASPPLSFASLDLLRRAEESSGPVSAEVHLFGAPGEHIVQIRSVRNKGAELTGLIHISLEVSLLGQTLASLPIGEGYLELRQAVGSRTVALGTAGRAPGVGEPTVVSVPDTRWNVAYWSGTAVAAPAAQTGVSATGLMLGGALLIVAAGGGAWFYRRRVQAAPMAPSAPGIIYAGAVKAIMDGAHPGMEQLIPHLPRTGRKGPIGPVSEGMAGDDITMMIKKEQMQSQDGEFVDITGAAPATSEPKPAVAPKQPAPTKSASGTSVSAGIFRAYDIRGVVGKTLTPEVVQWIGQSIGSEAAARGVPALALGRDGRKSSPELSAAMSKGLQAAGRDVIDVGMVPTPLLYFATHHLELGSGVMVTGSHNGPEYNGVKIVLAGETLSEEGIQGIYQRIRENNLESGTGSMQSADIVADYIRRVSDDIPVALGGAFKLVVDCGNGVAGGVAPQLLQALGHDVIELYCDVDGGFPNHHPDPSQPENLQALIARVHEAQADLGLAFDGDGDRLGVVDGEGNIIWPDRQLMLLAQDVLSRNPGAPVIFDVKCSRHLRDVIKSSGGEPLMWRTGHSLIKSKMKEVDAPLAGEMSGHIFFKERWYGFDDALYTAARLLEVLMKTKKKPAEVFKELPQSVCTPELRVEMAEEAHKSFMGRLKEKMSFEGAEVYEVDGFRIEFPDGWGLIRPSNTSPVLVLRFEADSAEALDRIQGLFRGLLHSVNPDLKLPF